MRGATGQSDSRRFSVTPIATRGNIRHKKLILNSQNAYELKLAVSWLALDAIAMAYTDGSTGPEVLR